MQVHRVNGLEEKGEQDVRPNPESGMHLNMAGGENNGRAARVDLPSKAKLIANGLNRLGQFFRGTALVL